MAKKVTKPADGTTLAYCYASGQIGFTSSKLPSGALPIARGPDADIRDRITARARHGYEPGVLLVPGIPEAEDQFAGIEALQRFIEFVGGRYPFASKTENV